jgi:hypothetical protein
MKKQFNRIRKCTMELVTIVADKRWGNFTEEDLDILAESMDLLNDIYETLYNEVFVEVDTDEK